MSKEYKNKNSKLSHSVYMQTIYFIRGHDDRCEEYRRILEGGSLPPDGTPKGTNRSDPTALKAERLAKLSKKISAVERALKSVPEEYREGVYMSIAYRDRLPDYANKNTWSKWRMRFISRVADVMGF